jgi:hypothetical protein
MFQWVMQKEDGIPELFSGSLLVLAQFMPQFRGDLPILPQAIFHLRK